VASHTLLFFKWAHVNQILKKFLQIHQIVDILSNEQKNIEKPPRIPVYLSIQFCSS